MAEKRVIELEIQDNSKSLKAQYKEAVQELQKVSAQYGETSAQAIKAAKAAADLKDQIGFSKDLVDSFNPDAKFNALSKSVGGVLDGFQAVEGAMGLVGVESEALQETMLRVQSAMALSQGVQGLMEAKDSFKQLKAVVVSAITSITAAKTAENVATEAGVIVENQSLLAKGKNLILTGLQTVATTVLTAAQYAYNLAISLNPIGLMVAAAIALVSVGYKLVSMFQEAEAETNNYNKSIKKSTEELKKQNAELAKSKTRLEESNKFQLDYAKASGKSAEELRKLAIKHAEEELALARKNKEIAKSTYLREKDILSSMKANDADDEVIKKQTELVTKAGDSAKQMREIAQDEYKELVDLKKQQRIEIKQEQTDSLKDQKENNKSLIDAQKEKLNDELDQIKEFIKQAKAETAERLRTEQENEELAVNEKFNTQIKLAKKHGKDTTALEIEQANQLNEIRLKYQAQEYAKAEELRQKELDAIKESNRLKLEAEQELQAQIEAIDEANFQAGLQKSMTEDEYALELVRQKYFALEEAAKGNAEQLAIIEAAKALEIEAIDKKSKDKQVAAENELRQKRLQLAGQAFTAIGDIIGAFTAKNDKDARKQFEIQKAFNLAAAVTNTAMAVTGALTAGGNPIKLATGMQFVEAGIAAATGAVNIAKIASSRFGGGGGGSTPSAAGGGVMSPNFNVIGGSGVNQLAQIQQQPTRAYVVSGDVANGLSLERNRLQNATL